MLDFFQRITPVLPFLTLLITIIGWTVTAWYQRRILERQIQADKDKQRRDVVLSQRLEQLNEIKSWLQSGEQMWRLRKTKSDELTLTKIRDDFADWKSRLGKINTSSSIVDSRFPPPTQFSRSEAIIFGIVLFTIYIVRGRKASDDAYKVLSRWYPKHPSLRTMVDRFFELIEDSVMRDINDDKNIEEYFGKALSRIDSIATRRMFSS